MKPLEHALLLLSHLSDTPHTDILAASIVVRHRQGAFMSKLPLQHGPPAVHPKTLFCIVMHPSVELESGTFRAIEHLSNEILLALCALEQTIPQLVVDIEKEMCVRSRIMQHLGRERANSPVGHLVSLVCGKVAEQGEQ